MASTWKPTARLRALTGQLDLEGGEYVMILCRPEHVDTAALETVADVVAAGGEIVDAGYVRQAVTWQTPTLDAAGSARAVFDDVTFGPLTSTSVGGWYIAEDGPTDASSALLFYGVLDEVEVVGDSLLVAAPLSGAAVLT